MIERRQPTSFDIEVGRRIRERRIAAGMSQGHLGKLIGTTHQQIYHYEYGERRIYIERLVDIAAALNCKPLELIP